MVCGKEAVTLFSTKGRYALRVMADLAQQKSGGFVPLEEIAHRQGISKKYLEIILKSLVREKLLKGMRGKGGGYKLTRKPSEYTVGEILELTEGTLAVVACLREGADICPRANICTTLPMWKRFNTLVRNFFYGITLDEIVSGKLTLPLCMPEACQNESGSCGAPEPEYII